MPPNKVAQRAGVLRAEPLLHTCQSCCFSLWEASLLTCILFRGFPQDGAAQHGGAAGGGAGAAAGAAAKAGGAEPPAAGRRAHPAAPARRTDIAGTQLLHPSCTHNATVGLLMLSAGSVLKGGAVPVYELGSQHVMQLPMALSSRHNASSEKSFKGLIILKWPCHHPCASRAAGFIGHKSQQEEPHGLLAWCFLK